MKKIFAFALLLLNCQLIIAPMARAATIQSGVGASTGGGLKIQKAGAVKETPKEEGVEASIGTNFIGTAIGLATGIMQIKDAERGLTSGCAPSQSDVDFVNKMMQEYAKMGRETPRQMIDKLSGANTESENCSYNSWAMTQQGAVCYERFSEEGKIWNKYPKASRLSSAICPPDKSGCAEKDKRYYSNAYEVYGYMGWSEADLMSSEEVSNHAKLMKKIEECDPAVLKKKKQEMTMGLVTNTLGGLGQKQNTGGVMEQVGAMMQTSGGGGSNPLGSLAPMGMSMLPGLLGK